MLKKWSSSWERLRKSEKKRQWERPLRRRVWERCLRGMHAVEETRKRSVDPKPNFMPLLASLQ
jgi:hypothetical protein